MSVSRKSEMAPLFGTESESFLTSFFPKMGALTSTEGLVLGGGGFGGANVVFFKLGCTFSLFTSFNFCNLDVTAAV